MPIYEYICSTCNKKVTVFLRTASPEAKPLCPVCGNGGLTRIISSFAIHKSISTIYEESGTPGGAISADYYKDPRNIGRWTEKKFEEMGMEMPSQVQGMIQAAREGDMPESVKDLQPGLTEV